MIIFLLILLAIYIIVEILIPLAALVYTYIDHWPSVYMRNRHRSKVGLKKLPYL